MDKCTAYTQMDVWMGAAEELVAAGIVLPSQLPHHPGPVGCSSEIKHLAGAVFYRHGERVDYVRRIDTQPDAEHWMPIECLSDGRYAVFKGIPREERLRRRRESAERYRKEREVAQRQLERSEVARQQAAIALRSTKNQGMTEAAFRQRLRDEIMIAAVQVLSHFEGFENDRTEFPFRFTRVSWESFRKPILAAVEAIDAAKVIPINTGLTAARADASFQQFLAAQCIAIADE